MTATQQPAEFAKTQPDAGPDDVVQNESHRTHPEMTRAKEKEERLSGIIDGHGHRLSPAVAFALIALVVILSSVAAILIFSWTV